MRMRLLLALTLVAGSCGGGSGDATTSTLPSATTITTSGTPNPLPAERTLWGFTPFPARPGLDGTIDAYRIADDHGDLIAHHLDECVPWDALENRTELPYDLSDSLQLRNEQSPRDAVVYVAVSLSARSRRDVAPDCGGVQRDRRFDDPEVIAAARDWVDLVVGRLQPVFLDVGVEFNLLGSNRPDLREGFDALILDLVDHVHARHPGVVVVASVQSDTMADVAEVVAVANAVDLLGISIFPTAFGATTLPPDDSLDALADLGPPLAITGTGWPAAPTVLDDRIVPFTEEGQVAYVEWLGRIAERHDLRFVVWFFPGDLDSMYVEDPTVWGTAGASAPHMGLVADDGTERPALDLWDSLRES